MTNPLSPVPALGKIGRKSLAKLLDAVNTKPSYTKNQLNALSPLSSYNGALVFCSNGAAGFPCLAYCDGTIWHQVALGGALA